MKNKIKIERHNIHVLSQEFKYELDLKNNFNLMLKGNLQLIQK